MAFYCGSGQDLRNCTVVWQFLFCCNSLVFQMAEKKSGKDVITEVLLDVNQTAHSWLAIFATL